MRNNSDRKTLKITGILFLIYSISALNPLFCKAQGTIAPSEHFDALQCSVYDLALGHIADADSLAGGKLPYKSIVERVLVVVDTAVTDADSITVRLRQAHATLFASGNITPESRWQTAGEVFAGEPLFGTGSAEDTVVIAINSGGVPQGHVRIFIYYRRLY